MIIRVDQLARTDCFAGQLRTTIGDHLIRVRVRACAGPSLKNVDWEMLVEFALDHLFRRLNDEGGTTGVEQPKIMVGLGCAPFDQAERTNKGAAESIAAHRKIQDRTLGRRA